MIALAAVYVFIGAHVFAAYLLECRRRGQWITPATWLCDRPTEDAGKELY